MKKLLLPALGLVMLLPLGGCADDGYSTGYYGRSYYGGAYSSNYDAGPYYRHRYYYNNGYGWPY